MNGVVKNLLTQAISLESTGRAAEARAIYERVLVLEPNHPGALLKLALLDHAGGDSVAARNGLERALAAARAAGLGIAPVFLAQGDILRLDGETDAARRAYEAALLDRPGLSAARFRLGQLALAANDLAVAESLFSAVIAAEPANVGARMQLAITLAGQARIKEAVEAADEAVNAAPGSPQARHLAATLALRANYPARAEAHCRAGLAYSPTHTGLLLLLGQVLQATGAIEEAITALTMASKSGPGEPGVWLTLGGCLMERQLAMAASPASAQYAGGPETTTLPLLRQAIDAFGRAVELAPDVSQALSSYAMTLRYACAWDESDGIERRLSALSGRTGFAVAPLMAAVLIDSPDVQRLAIAGWSRSTLPAATPRVPAALVARGNRLRIGYLSADFHAHATAYLTAGLFERHDRARVETFAYACDRDDGSSMRRRLLRAFDHWRDMRGMNDAEAATRIEADRLHVLVDLSSHTYGSRASVLARRPAPLQIHWLGFPGTIAYDAIDAIVADAVIVPPGDERAYAERVLRMPVCYQVNDRDRALPDAPSRAEAGLPERALVLACFNQAAKLTRPFFEIWLDVLLAHGDAVLWLLVPEALARENLCVAAERRDVAPSRIVFAPHLPRDAHTARLRCADLALDILPCSSHTTGSDALWAALPLLTCRGTTFAGRVGASLASAAGIADLVAPSLAAYRDALHALVDDRAKLATYRDHLERERMNLPLFDTDQFARDFERLLESACNLR